MVKKSLAQGMLTTVEKPAIAGTPPAAGKPATYGAPATAGKLLFGRALIYSNYRHTLRKLGGTFIVRNINSR